MRKLTFFFTLFLTALLFTQCQKEISYVGGPDPVVITPEPITANLQGNIIDENGQPAAGVTIKAGGTTAITDAGGYFRINNASLDKKTALVTAEKSGYFKALRTFSATDGTNQVIIQLIKRSLAGTVSGTTGGDAVLSNGAKITLPANGVVNAATGAAYTGSIKVFAAFIDPTSSNIDQVVPGSFMATNKDGGRVTLASFGMLAVELEGASGEKLQIKSGSAATLSAPIPSSLQASAPATLPMWFVDETTGLWKEEGSATRQGNTYVGDVKHFTYWNYDSQLPAIHIEMTVKDANGNPVVHAYVRVVRAAAPNAGAGHGYTDSLGHAAGMVAANEPLVLQIRDLCGNVVYTQNIGPFSSNTNLGVITIPATAPSQLEVKGKLLTCSNTPVVDGYAIIKIGNSYRYAKTDAQGRYHVSIIHCGPVMAAEVIGVDKAANQQSTLSTTALTLPVTTIPDLTACGVSANEFVDYTVDGVTYNISANIGDSLYGHTSQVAGATTFGTTISGMKYIASTPNNPNIFHVEFGHSVEAPGTYAIGALRVQNYQQGNTLLAPSNITFTAFPTSIAGFYEGTLNASFKDASNVTHMVTATFRVRRI